MKQRSRALSPLQAKLAKQRSKFLTSISSSKNFPIIRALTASLNKATSLRILCLSTEGLLWMQRSRVFLLSNRASQTICKSLNVVKPLLWVETSKLRRRNHSYSKKLLPIATVLYWSRHRLPSNWPRFPNRLTNLAVRFSNAILLNLAPF